MHSTRIVTLSGITVLTALVAGPLLARNATATRQLDQSKDTACTSNMKQVATGLLMYIQDYDEKLPPMKSMAKLQPLLMPYIRNKSVFVCPATGKPYKPNASIGGKKLAAIKLPAMTTAFSDAKPHPDGMMFTAFVDGHVKGKATPKAGKK